LIYALLLSPDEAMRTTQLTELAKRVEPVVCQKTVALYPDVSAAATHARLPIVNLALGALRHLSAEQFDQFSQTLQWLVESDGKIELFEFVLQKIVLRNLATQFSKVRPPVVQYYSLKPLLPDCAVLLSALANVGNSDAAQIQNAFNQGAPYLRAPNIDLTLLPGEQCGLNQVDTAADGVIQESEAELLRAIADTLDCPIPPFLVDDKVSSAA
jgi:hypothetical protein